MSHAAGLAILLAALAGCAPGQQTVGEMLAGYAPAPVPEATAEVTNLEIGRRLLAAGQPETALKAFLRSASIDGLSAAAMTGAGVAAEQIGLARDARTYFRAAVELDPNSILARNNYGVALYRAGDYQGARAAFQAAFVLSGGTNAVAAQNLALVDHKIAELAQGDPVPVDLGYAVVRTGSSVYAIEPSGIEIVPDAEAGGG